jgi:TRAP-type C4-dicarboxylate transport system substrate-binding protein
MRPRAHTTITCIAASLLCALTGCGGGGDKGGGDGGTRTLTLATPDAPGRPASAAVQRFADELRRRTGGRLRVKIAWEPNVETQGGHKPGAEQEIVRLVRSGEYPFAMVPARTWDTRGVPQFAALQTPFLIASNDLAGRVARDAVAARALDGLEDAGVVGLALLPEGLRHPVGFARPLLGPDDYVGKRMRVLPSHTSFELFRAFGAEPVDLNGGGFTTAARLGSVAGAESSLALAPTLPAGTITANVALFPKFNTLVVARDEFDDLPDSQRRALRDAARATLSFVLATNPTEAEAAAAACRAGYGVAVAPRADVDALEARAAPVIAKLERDPDVGPLVARIRALKSSVATASEAEPEVCKRRDVTAEPAGRATTGGRSSSPIDGVYRWMLTEQGMIRAGADREGAYRNSGLQTMTLHDGRFESVTAGGPSGGDTCTGTFTVENNHAEFAIDSPDCSGHWRLRWTRTKDGLRMSDSVSLPPYDRRADQALDRVIWTSKPWRRIAGGPPADATFPEGNYRAKISEADLVKRGVSRENAYNHYGLLTLAFEDGRFRVTDRAGARAGQCSGRFAADGDRVTVTADPGEGCGSAAGREFFSARWTRRGPTLRFVDLEGDDPVIEALFAERDWRLIR